jgi:hypothetical protein
MDGFEIVVPGRMPRSHPSRTTTTTITELCARAAYEVARLDAVLERSAPDQATELTRADARYCPTCRYPVGNASGPCDWCRGPYGPPEVRAKLNAGHNGHDALAQRSGPLQLPQRPVIQYGPPSPILGVR